MSGIFYPTSVWLPILVPALLLAIIGLSWSVNLRLAFVALGGFFILDSSANFDAPKMVYMAGYAFVFGLAVIDWRRSTTGDRPLVALSLALFSLAGLSLPVAILNHTPLVNWLRDVASLLFVASAPIFALDARKLRSSSILLMIFVATGLFGSVTFAYEVMHRYSRGAGMEHASALVSAFLPVALFTYATAELIIGKGFRAGWAMISVGVLAMLLLSGSRGMLAVMLIPIVMIIVGLQASWWKLVKYTVESVVVAGIALVLLAYLAGSVGKAFGARGEQAVHHLLMIEVLMKHPSHDPSFQQRLSETIEATKVFLAQPILGAGPGHLFSIKRENNKVLTTFSMVDTPMEFPAKYGLTGIGILFIAGFALYRFIRRSMENGEGSASALALLGFCLYTVAGMLVSSPFDDKGYSMGLLFLLALCVIETKNNPSAVDAVRRVITI